jgi:hypothetical protein
MASTIKVDNVQNQPGTDIIKKCGTTVTVGASGNTINVCGASVVATGNVVKSNALQASDAGNIISQCGTTITVGASGDTISLASGASQSGFGREGSVDWATGDIKTATFSAVNGTGYFVNTTSGGVTVNLPAGSAGNIVAVNDYARTAATNNIVIAANGAEKIEGSTSNKTITVNGTSTTLVYTDSTQGWKVVDTGEISSVPTEALFTAATVTGACNTLTTAPDCGNYKIAKFVGPGTFCVSQVGNSPTNPLGGPANTSYLVVAGGAGGRGGGGGAGGYRTDHPSAAGTIPVAATPYSITVGAGGASGSTSTFSTIDSAGGGRGGNFGCQTGDAGGSGGGGTGVPGGSPGAGGAGNTPSTPVAQGYPGGEGVNVSGYPSGGGGGATDPGGPGSPTPNRGGDGGAGTCNSITGSAVRYADGGGGTAQNYTLVPGGPNVAGGPSGGRGAYCGSSTGASGVVNTGGGGGGGWCAAAGDGGSGIVIIRYKFQ